MLSDIDDQEGLWIFQSSWLTRRMLRYRTKNNNMCLPPGYHGKTYLHIRQLFQPRNVYVTVLNLGYAVEMVKKSKAKMSDEYLRSMADFTEIRGRPPLVMRAMSDFIVSDNTRTGLTEIDFGWGKPVYAGVTKSSHLISFYVRNINKEEKCEILVPICWPSKSMERFQQEYMKMINFDKMGIQPFIQAT